jgi:1,5-anhydro-D-fructose reductase (1,5-anhydro-D-mannitol-forming)
MDIQDPERLGQKYGVSATDSLDAVLERDDVDAVYVASPVHAHAEQVIAAARAGKHVLCEKPLGLSVAEAQTMVDACREAGVLLREAYMLRHHALHIEMARLIADGAIGKPLFVSVQWAFLYPKMEGAWRQISALGGGGALADVGCHVFDLVHMLVGRTVRVAAVSATVVQDYEVDDITTVLMALDGGAQGSVTTSFCISDAVMPASVSIFGSGGSIIATGSLTQTSDGTATLHREENGDRRDIPYEKVDTYARQLEVFADNVASGAVTTKESETDLLRAMRVLEASYASARTGEFVSV